VRFAVGDVHQQFAASLHEALAAAGDTPWPVAAELGVTGLAVPQDRGGLGGDAIDLVVAFEELGHHAVPGPVVESMAVIPTLLADLGDERWLPGLADATLVGTLAYPPHVPYALDADTADLVLHVTDTTVRLASPTGGPKSSVDTSRRLFAVEPGEVVGSGAMARAFDVGVLACSAQLLGAGRAMLELATGYVRQRTQFGRPIGQFQAVKHRLADVLVGLELARPLLHGAAVAVAARAPSAGRDVSAAKVATTTAAYRAARAALQVHGAVGYTREYALSRWFTKVTALRAAWGTLSAHRARVAEALR
jgi:alkylation response protein AidB-like acyl-CoA dehydrogenase